MELVLAAILSESVFRAHPPDSAWPILLVGVGTETTSKFGLVDFLIRQVNCLDSSLLD